MVQPGPATVALEVVLTLAPFLSWHRGPEGSGRKHCSTASMERLAPGRPRRWSLTKPAISMAQRRAADLPMLAQYLRSRPPWRTSDGPGCHSTALGISRTGMDLFQAWRWMHRETS